VAAWALPENAVADITTGASRPRPALAASAPVPLLAVGGAALAALALRG
jgi:hypothetical protein